MTAPSSGTAKKRPAQARTATEPRAHSTLGARLRDFRGQARAFPGLDYYALLVVILCLIGIGVLMAFSASMATSVQDTYNVWTVAIRQCLLVFVGLIAFWVGLRLSPHTVRKVVPWLLLLSIALLVAVLIPGVGTGREEVGSQSWIEFSGIRFQPSELARVTIGLYGATALADKPHKSMKLSDPFMMYQVIAAVMFILIILQGDLGMAVSFAMVVVFTLIFAGVNWRVPAVIISGGILGMLAVFAGGGFRSHRFHTYFDALRGNIVDTQGTGFQAYQGFLSLADGGFWGVGLGQSRAKWFYLPEAKNDFVFAIIGEELGWWGGGLVIVLFAVLGYVGLRTAMRAQDQFQSLAAATLTVGVVLQAFINIGYVIGMLPVTGIQLPMISAGGSSAIITIGTMGILCNVARHEPLEISAMQNYGRPLFDRLFFIPEPRLSDAVGPSRAQRPSGQHSGQHSGQPRGGAEPSPRARAGRAGAEQPRGDRGGRRRSAREERFGQAVTSRREYRRAGESGSSRAGESGSSRAGESSSSRAGENPRAAGRETRSRGRGERGSR